MANIKSAKKRIAIAERNRLRNKSKRSEIKTYIKKFDQVLEEEKTTEAQELLKVIDKKLKRASLSSGVSKNAASRRISKLQKKLNEAVAAQ
ncbi:MAG: 30S ribosomal protein S20 [Firmicutes bacterium]|nr:30S ribosomal protein S20 [Bacillota bacterium]